MAGWLDFLEVEITCPFCNSKIIVTIWEDGNPKRESLVITGLMDGETICPICGKMISDDALK